MTLLTGVLLTFGLTIATGYFVAQEFAYVAVDRGRLRVHADAGDRAAARALRVCQRLSFTLSGAQLGITVTALLVGYLAEPFVGAGFNELLGTTSELGGAARLSVSVAVALLFATGVQMVFGELAPKNWAIAQPERLARALSRSTLAYLFLAGPVIKLFDAAANRLLRRAGVEPVDELPEGMTAEDLERVVAEASAGGTIDRAVSDLLRRGLGFRTLTAEQAMTPRVRVQTIEASAYLTDAIALLDSGYSRFPVIGQDSDEIRGIVGAKEIMLVRAAARAHTTVGSIAAVPLVVPATLRLTKVLELLRGEHRQLACVADEYGGFAGVVSLEDIAEELVGQIRDEDDPAEPSAIRQADGSWLLPAQLRIDEVREATGFVLPSREEYETLSGLIMMRLGRLAQVGDRVAVVVENADRTSSPEQTPQRSYVDLTVTAVTRHVPSSVVLRTRPVGDVQ